MSNTESVGTFVPYLDQIIILSQELWRIKSRGIKRIDIREIKLSFFHQQQQLAHYVTLETQQ